MSTGGGSGGGKYNRQKRSMRMTKASLDNLYEHTDNEEKLREKQTCVRFCRVSIVFINIIFFSVLMIVFMIRYYI